MIARETQDIRKYTPGRLAFLGLSSVVLYLSFFATVLTPLPVALSSLLYGRTKGYLLACGLVGLFALIATQVYEDGSLMIMFTLGMVIALSTAEVIHRGLSPVRGIVMIGTLMLAVFAGLIGLYTTTAETTIKESLVKEFVKAEPLFQEQIKALKASGEGNLEWETLLGDPELLAEETIKTAPAMLAMSVFIVLWINIFLTMRLSKVFRIPLKKTEKDLLRFAVPEQFIWVVILALGLYLGGDQLGRDFSDIGLTILKVLGVFYFFHGFGIYIAFLDKYRVFGVARSLMVIMTVFMASWAIAVVGVADTFADFRKLMNKKNQGE